MHEAHCRLARRYALLNLYAEWPDDRFRIHIRILINERVK